MIVLYCLITLFFSYINANTAGKAWVTGKKADSGFLSLMSVMVGVMAAAGFSWVFTLGIVAVARWMDYLDPLHLKLIIELQYLALIGPILTTGIGICLWSWMDFYKHRKLENAAETLYNTWALWHNISGAIRFVPEALKDVACLMPGISNSRGEGLSFGSGSSSLSFSSGDSSSSSNSDDWDELFGIVIICVVLCVVAGIVLTLFLAKRAADEEESEYRFIERQNALRDTPLLPSSGDFLCNIDLFPRPCYQGLGFFEPSQASFSHMIAFLYLLATLYFSVKNARSAGHIAYYAKEDKSFALGAFSGLSALIASLGLTWVFLMPLIAISARYGWLPKGVWLSYQNLQPFAVIIPLFVNIAGSMFESWCLWVKTKSLFYSFLILLDSLFFVYVLKSDLAKIPQVTNEIAKGALSLRGESDDSPDSSNGPSSRSTPEIPKGVWIAALAILLGGFGATFFLARASMTAYADPLDPDADIDDGSET